MKLSTKGRYAMVAMADLALLKPGELSALSEVSRRQNISLPYLEQLFVKLRRAGLVDSVRGPGGGYRLTRAPSDIRVVEIFAAVDETVDAMHIGACLRVPAPDAPVGRGDNRAAAMPRGADALRGGGRGLDRLRAAIEAAWSRAP